MTNVFCGSIRNRTSKLSHRSAQLMGMKPLKEDDLNGSSGLLVGVKTATLNDPSGIGENIIMSPPNNNQNQGDVDSSSSTDERKNLSPLAQPPHPPPLPPVQKSHRVTPKHPTDNNQHRNNHHLNNSGVNKEQNWGKNIEEGISGILKRLDELAVNRADHDVGSVLGTKKNGLIGPRAGLINNPVHRDIVSERMHYAKEREKLKLRVEELEKVNDKLNNEIRHWKTRHEEVVSENRHLLLLRQTSEDLQNRSSVVLTDLKGRPSVVRIDQLTDQNGKRSEAGWLSLWNVLPTVGPMVPIATAKSEITNFHPPDPEILLRCLQINLQHKKKAMERTKRLMLDRNIDIALIQEPYAIGQTNPELLGVPVGYTAFHNLTEQHPFGAAIIAKNSLRARLCSFGRNDVCGIQLRSGNKTYHFYSVFCRPSSLNLSSTLLPVLDQAPPTLVIGMDASAKHPKWNNGMVYRKIDQRGRELERLLDQYDMHLASPPLYKLKYIPENYSYIDVTLGGENIQFHDWKFWEDSLSDHPYIFFQVE